MLGKPIPIQMREEMDADPYYHQCARYDLLHDHICEADPVRCRLIEWEHAFTYGGSKVNEKWAIVPICYLVHRGGKMIKEINQWIGLNRATDEDLAKYPNTDWAQKKIYLNSKYGIPKLSTEKAPF